MRLIVQIWVLLALLLVDRNIAKAAGEEELIDIDNAPGSGDNEAPDNVETIDDEDNTGGPAEMGSGTETPAVMEAGGPSFVNTIRILKIGKKQAVFIPSYNDPNSLESQEVFTTVCSVATHSIEQNMISAVESCVGVSITEGSLIVKTKVTFPENTEVSAADVQGAVQDSLRDNAMTDGATKLTVDPESIMVEASSSDGEQPELVPTATKRPKGNKPSKPGMTPSTSKPNKGMTDNDIFFPTTMKSDKGDKTTVSNNLNNGDVNHDNKLGVKDEKDKEQNFFEMILGNPVLLAALVGAVVLTLITIVLIIMFLIYRVKKKDEGSYSLDEPHKVKDPTAYWKDTKEFYA